MTEDLNTLREALELAFEETVSCIVANKCQKALAALYRLEAAAAAEYERGRQDGMKQEHALWQMQRIGQEIEAAAVPVGQVPDGWVESNTLPPDGTPVLVRWPDDNPEADVPWRYAVGRYQAKRSVHHWWSAEGGLPRSFVVSPSHWRAI